MQITEIIAVKKQFSKSFYVLASLIEYSFHSFNEKQDVKCKIYNFKNIKTQQQNIQYICP